MQIEHLSKKDLVLAIEIINESLYCQTEGQLELLMGRFSELLPFQASLSCVFRRKNPESVISLIRIINFNYPVDYLEKLHQRNLLLKNPVLLENIKIFSLQDSLYNLQQQNSLNTHHELVSLVDDYRFYRAQEEVSREMGDLHPVAGSFFCYHRLALCARTKEVLKLVIPHFHEALKRIETSSNRKTDKLTNREKIVIQWLKEGKTTWDISVILNISQRTVKFHVSNILRKLDAVNRTHAVAKAMDQGIIELDYSI